MNLTDLLHDLAHATTPLSVLAGAAALGALVVVGLRRRPGLAALLLLLPALALLLLAMDLDRMWPVPHLMKPIPLDHSETHRFETPGTDAVTWKRRACTAFQINPGLPNGPEPLTLDVTIRVMDAAADAAGVPLGEKRITGEDWREEFSMGGDNGAICFPAPADISAEVEVHQGDPRMADLDTRFVVAVPRHHIVCPEELRGTALAGSVPLALALVAALLIHSRRRRRDRAAEAQG